MVSSEDSGFGTVGQRVILMQDEDLWRAAKPFTQQCILGDQTEESLGESSKCREENLHQLVT